MSFVLHDQLGQLAGKVANGTSTVDGLREMLGITIAVVGAAEQLYRPYPDQWESMERSAETFTDQFVVKWMAK